MKRDIILVLPDIRSAHNVGSIFRTADAAGVEKIYLAGYTPAPRNQFGRVNKEIAKTALGAEETLPWQVVVDTLTLISKLKQDGYQIVALEQAPGAKDYRTTQLAEKVAILVGNEVAGVASEILAQVDLIAEIPMRGHKESLNVAVALGVALFHWLD